MKKSILMLLTGFLLLSVLTGCGAPATQSGSAGISTVAAPDRITLTGSTAKYSGTGVVINGNVITINAEGEYYLTGKLDDGQIVVNTGETAQSVYLYLENADITCLSAPAIYVLQAKKVHIVLPEGTENRLVSGTEANMENYDPNASGGAIYAEDDVDIEGEGSLTILGYINNGITCKDDVQIEGGTVSVTAANNGIRGSESVTVTGGHLSVTCGNDGIKSTSAEKEGKGFVQIDDGTLELTTGGDGISAETELIVNGGNITVNTTGDSLLVSCKAMKANNTLTIQGGSLNLSSDDNNISSNVAVNILGGEITAVSSSRKGIHADEMIHIADGTVAVDAGEEGIQTRGDIEISGGSIQVRSVEDGFKAGDKGDGSTVPVGTITVTGGQTRVEAGGDPLEAKVALVINGGSVFGIGSPKNVKQADAASAQASISVSLSGKSGEEVRIEGEGAEFTWTAQRAYGCLFYTDPGVVAGADYSVVTGDNSLTVTAR